MLPPEDWPETTLVSRAHADNSEWKLIVKAGIDRGMFAMVDEADLFVNQLGAPVLNGVMGVDKEKDVDGVLTTLLRFICILTRLNQYMRKLGGDEHTLPQAAFLSRIISEDGESLVVDGEDLQSFFNLFRLHKAWRGYMAFEKKSPKAAVWLRFRRTSICSVTDGANGLGSTCRYYPKYLKEVRL